MLEYNCLVTVLSHLVCKHGSEQIYKIIYAQARQEAEKKEPNKKNSDLLSYLAATIVSEEIQKIERTELSDIGDIKCILESIDLAFDEICEILEKIQFEKLDLSEYLAYGPRFPSGRKQIFQQPRQPIQILDKKIEDAVQPEQKTNDIEYRYLLTEECQKLITNQLDLYEKTLSYSKRINKDNDNCRFEKFRELSVQDGKLYKILELREDYKLLKSQLEEIHNLVKKINATQNKYYEKIKRYNIARCTIESLIPYCLVSKINVEQLKKIETSALALPSILPCSTKSISAT